VCECACVCVCKCVCVCVCDRQREKRHEFSRNFVRIYHKQCQYLFPFGVVMVIPYLYIRLALFNFYHRYFVM
jgi:hypothetical protein